MLMTDPESPQSRGPANSEFMRELLHAAPRGTYGWVCNFIGQPRPGADWGGRPYRGGGELEQEVDTWRPYNTYFSVAALGIGADGEQGRRKGLFSRLLALVVDDVQLDSIQGRVSYRIETSPGKNQVGVFLDADDPDCADQALVDAVMRRLFEMKLLGDSSGNNLVRYVRLPVGSNLKPRETGPWQHVVHEWSPSQRLSLADACAAFGVDLDELRGQAQAVVEGVQLGPQAEQDERLAALVGNVVRGLALHESLNQIAASLVGSGAQPGAVVNVLRGLMVGSLGARDDRWHERYADIPRSVRTAQEKFARPVLQPLAADVEAEPEKPELIVKASTLLGSIGRVDWLISNYLERSATSMMFGPPGNGKSFVAIDQACCVATGRPWHNNPVRQGPVLIVAGEGHAGLSRRLKAWEVLNGTSLADAPLYVTRRSVPLLDISKAFELVEHIDRICAELGVAPALIVIDTLARNFGAGDENSAADASRFIETIDTYFREHYRGCHVMLVHHSGHQAGRARGSSAFKGAMDQEFQVKMFAGQIEYSSTKMKDAEFPATLQFRLNKDILIASNDTEDIYGAALVATSNPLNEVFYTARENGATVTRRDFLAAIENSWVAWPKLAEKFGLPVSGKNNEPKGLQKAMVKLVAEGWVTPRAGGGYELTDQARVKLSHTGAYALGEADPEEVGDGE